MELFEAFFKYAGIAAWALAVATAGAFIKKQSVLGWKLVLAGSIFVLLRALIEFLPAYDTSVAWNIARYSAGSIGAVILYLGFYDLYNRAK